MQVMVKFAWNTNVSSPPFSPSPSSPYPAPLPPGHLDNHSHTLYLLVAQSPLVTESEVIFNMSALRVCVLFVRGPQMPKDHPVAL